MFWFTEFGKEVVKKTSMLATFKEESQKNP